MGGGMRQSGFLAAAGLFALENHIERLREDHAHARILGECLRQMPYVAQVKPVMTNIVIFELAGLSAAAFLDMLHAKGIKGSAFGPRTIRLVTHLDIHPDMISRTLEVLQELTGPALACIPKN